MAPSNIIPNFNIRHFPKRAKVKEKAEWLPQLSRRISTILPVQLSCLYIHFSVPSLQEVPLGFSQILSIRLLAPNWQHQKQLHLINHLDRLGTEIQFRHVSAYSQDGSDADDFAPLQISPEIPANDPTNGANERTSSPRPGNVNDSLADSLVGLPSPPNGPHTNADVTNHARQQIVPPTPATPKTTGLPSPSQQAQSGMSRSAEPPRNTDANPQDAPAPDLTHPGVSQDAPMTQDEGEGGVDFSHLLGNDLFNSMNGAEDGADYDINFANFGMDGDIFEIYMNDGYDGAQAGEGS